MATFKEREQSIQLTPTRVFLEATMFQSGGDIRDEAVFRIRRAMLDAFSDAASREGLASTWTLQLRAKTSKDFNTLLANRRMCLEEPVTVPPTEVIK